MCHRFDYNIVISLCIIISRVEIKLLARRARHTKKGRKVSAKLWKYLCDFVLRVGRVRLQGGISISYRLNCTRDQSAHGFAGSSGMRLRTFKKNERWGTHTPPECSVCTGWSFCLTNRLFFQYIKVFFYYFIFKHN